MGRATGVKGRRPCRFVCWWLLCLWWWACRVGAESLGSSPKHPWLVGACMGHSLPPNSERKAPRPWWERGPVLKPRNSREQWQDVAVQKSVTEPEAAPGQKEAVWGGYRVPKGHPLTGSPSALWGQSWEPLGRICSPSSRPVSYKVPHSDAEPGTAGLGRTLMLS